MDEDAAFAALARQAEHFSEEVGNRGLAESWRKMASGLWELARLQAAVARALMIRPRNAAGPPPSRPGQR